ncbi:MAG: sialate O-acetylesterase [Firmicutes bacterium]|nr:sialate O-acetylesterase [Bacillota bacterium]
MFSITNAPMNWEIIQACGGNANITLEGKYEKEANGEELIVKAYDEETDEPITEWMYVNENGNDWSISFNLPLGGPYRIEIRKHRNDVWLARGKCEAMIHHICVGDVFVVAGQSNAIGTGHGEMTETAEFGVHVFRDLKFWDIATNPLHFGRANHGPYLTFAKRLKKSLNYPIGLIPCAYGGSSISDWSKENNGFLYNEMISVINDKSIKGILWYQGEYEAMNCDSENYFEKFCTFVKNIRQDTNNPNLPIITCQLNRHTDDFDNGDEMDIHYTSIREAQRKAFMELDNISIVPTIDAGRLSDGIHNSKSANMLIGERLARQTLYDIYKKGLNPSAPNVQYIKQICPNKIEIKFNFVEDTLMAYHVKNAERFPIRVTDSLGKNAIESFEIKKDKIILLLNRDIKDNVEIDCQFGRNPNNYIQDFGKQIAVLCFRCTLEN